MVYHDDSLGGSDDNGNLWLGQKPMEECICDHTDSFCPIHNGSGCELEIEPTHCVPLTRSEILMICRAMAKQAIVDNNQALHERVANNLTTLLDLLYQIT